MGVIYQLYDAERRAYIDLGKRRGEGFGFQMPDRRIVEFVGAAEGPLVLAPEEGPWVEEPGWKCADHWAHKLEAPCDCEMCEPLWKPAEVAAIVLPCDATPETRCDELPCCGLCANVREVRASLAVLKEQLAFIPNPHVTEVHLISDGETLRQA
jgi:hypothetical protein